MVDLYLEARREFWRAIVEARGDGPITLADRILRPAWMRSAACAGAPSELFFPARGQTTAAARAYCERCPVVDECGELGRGEQGVWGGLGERERRRGPTDTRR
jgi:Transcription factor WhiB.